MDDLYGGLSGGAVGAVGTAAPPRSTMSIAAVGMRGGSLQPPRLSTGAHSSSTVTPVPAGDGAARPMTSIRSAGYTGSRPRTGAAGSGAARSATSAASAFGVPPPLAAGANSTPEAVAREMTAKVHALLEASAAAAAHGDAVLALERAKEAGRRERTLAKHHESTGLMDSFSADLTYGVCFNLATAYANAGMRAEALSTYNLIVKNRAYPNAGRLRVNIGNIHFEAGEFTAALKQYRMALDSIPAASARLRAKVQRNVGICLVRTGSIHDAISAFEAAADPGGHAPAAISQSVTGVQQQQQPARLHQSDSVAAFNLLVCYVALGDTELMRRSFTQLLEIPLSLPDVISGETGRNNDSKGAAAAAAARRPSITSLLGYGAEGPNHALNSPLSDAGGGMARGRSSSFSSTVGSALMLAMPDALTEELRSRQRAELARIVTAAKLIAPHVSGPGAWQAGFDWTISQLRDAHPSAASEVELAKALAFLKLRSFDNAVSCLRSFEKKDTRLKARASVNLSFIYYLEGDFAQAGKYAQLAVKTDRYNARALVNLGVLLVHQGEPERAKEMFLEAIGVEADCVEAIFNLGIVNKSMGLLGESLQAFEKLHSLTPDSPEALYHLGALHDSLGNYAASAKYFSVLVTRVPTDSGALARLGAVFAKADDEAQAFHFTSEAYRLLPTNLEVISWLGVWYVKCELYEKAVEFFDRASELQPSELKWRLMVASCYRRMGSYSRALDVYAAIHANNPDNIECLRYLVALCRDLGRKYDDYEAQLQRLQQSAVAQQQQRADAAAAVALQRQSSFNGDDSAASAIDADGGSDALGRAAAAVPAASPYAAPSDMRLYAAAGGGGRGGEQQQHQEDFADADLDHLLTE